MAAGRRRPLRAYAGTAASPDSSRAWQAIATVLVCFAEQLQRFMPTDLHGRFEQDRSLYPGVRSWSTDIKQRPALRRAMDVGKTSMRTPGQPMDEAARRMMFGQTGRSVQQLAQQAAGQDTGNG